MVDLAIQYKGEGCTNGDIICMLGVAESTFYRWTCHPRGKLQRALSEGLKKAEGQFKRTMITTIGNAALASHRNWTAAAWLLERKYPNEYAQATRETGETQEAAPQIVLGVAVAPIQQQLPLAEAGMLDGSGGQAAALPEVVVTAGNSSALPEVVVPEVAVS